MNNFDVVIVGAGISGIGAAYHLQTRCPDKTYVILEGRERLGGTWDLFRYPGIRSDSDMYTLGFSFRPWTEGKAIADGDAILNYLRETAETYGIDRMIRYRHRVERARWSTAEGRWTLDVRKGTGELVRFTCKFMFACAGYYDYEAGYTPPLAGAEQFRGQIVHPQRWPESIDYAGKRVVVIGSGATAMTLVPALANKAAHVTMLQRSPTYVASRPARDAIADRLNRWLPERLAYGITRWKNVLMATAFYQYSRSFPGAASRLLVGQVAKAIGDKVDVAQHFTPSYKPWDQRLCLIPDGDLFRAIQAGTVSVVTDHIDRFTETGIRLRSGKQLEADLIVTATGLRLRLVGGIALEVDGQTVDASQKYVYRGLMVSDLPNLAVAIGYTNSSWTLKSELTAMYVCRLLQHMDKHGYAVCTPSTDGADLEDRPLLDLAAGYVQRGAGQFPRQGSAAPWRLYQNYVLDRAVLRYAPIDDGTLRFTTPAPAQRTRVADAIEGAA
jgi:cation diffusion facilitator CzcD-associated flavoprotein CzcO